MQKHIKRTVIVSVAIVFIALGFVGLVLPFLQGFLFIAIGLILLSLYSPRVREWTDRHTMPYPKLHEMVKKVEAWVGDIVGRD